MQERGEILEQYKWKLEDIFGSYDDFKKEYEKISLDISGLKEYEFTLMDNAKNLYSALCLSDEIERRIDKLASYASLSLDVDTRDNSKLALNGEVENLLDLYNKASYFITPSILKSNYEDVCKFYEEIPELRNYDVVLKRTFRYKEHTLSDNEEKMLFSMNKAFGNDYEVYSLFIDGELSFNKIKDASLEEVELTNSNYSVYIEDQDRRVRREAFETLYKYYRQFKNTFAGLLSGMVKQNVTLAKIRKYDSAMEMSLYRDELDSKIYNNLIKSISDNISILHKYYGVKKRLLGLSELHLYDVYVPLVGSVNKKYSYDEALDIIFSVVSVLGDEYVSVLKKGILEEGWIDVYPNKGKRGGAYSGGSYDTYPYILTNFQGKYHDVSTIIHEAGHSMHSYFTRKCNSYTYGHYSIFVAEVASTVNELLLARYMIDNCKDEKEKLFVLDQLLELFRATMYRQTMFAEFEKDIYEKASDGIPLTADLLSDEYYNLNLKYFGSDVCVDEEIRYEWERIPHFYYDFYVYKYATGLAAAYFIVDGILSGKEGAVSSYLDFLKCGSTKSPLESLKIAGVDLADKKVVDKALAYFDSLIDEFEILFDKVEGK